MSQLTLSSKNSVKQLSISAILTAFAILIPLMMPIKIIIGPASYTLASHIPLFIAMFISPATAIFVALGSSLGFFLAGFPIVIVFRALTHLFFLTLGAVLVKRFPILMDSKRFLLLGIGLNLLHGLGEYIVSFKTCRYFTRKLTKPYRCLDTYKVLFYNQTNRKRGA
ncbi:hypothetical protein ACYKLA_01525 [Streptococcus suis]